MPCVVKAETDMNMYRETEVSWSGNSPWNETNDDTTYITMLEAEVSPMDHARNTWLENAYWAAKECPI